MTSDTAAALKAQTINVTTPAPASAAYNSTFGVAATSDSGLDVAITTSGSCSGSGTNSATVTMTSGTGTCTVHYNQAGDANYSAATEVTSDTAAALKAQTINVTTPAPASAAYNSTFGVAATSDSGLDVAITTSGSCSGSGTNSATVTMTSGTGTCTVHYNQAGDANYSAATEVTDTTSATKADPGMNTWPTASSITYGQTLADSTLTGGSATPAGSFAFTTPSTVPDAGTASQDVTFTPTDTADYNTAAGTVSVTVNAAPSLTSATITSDGSSIGDLTGATLTTTDSGSCNGSNSDSSACHTLNVSSVLVSNGPLLKENDGFALQADATQQAALTAYFAAKGWPAGYVTQIDSEIAGSAPFFYFVSDGSGNYSLADGFQWGLGNHNQPLVIDDNYPAGTYTYAGTVGGNSVTVTLTVTKAPATVSVTGVSLNENSRTLRVGDTDQLTATISPSGATNQGVTWSSNNTSAATVDSSGLVTAVATSSATITVTTDDGGKTDTDAITVEAPRYTRTPSGSSPIPQGTTVTITTAGDSMYDLLKDYVTAFKLVFNTGSGGTIVSPCEASPNVIWELKNLSPDTYTLGAPLVYNDAVGSDYCTTPDGSVWLSSDSFTVVASPSDATITSASYTVDSTLNTIINVPFGTAKATFLAALTPATGATLDDSGITDPVVSANTLKVTAQDGVTTKTYTVTVNTAPSADATITSASYTVDSTLNTIINVPFGTAKATFLAALTPATGATLDDSGITDPVVSANTLKVTAQDGVTTKTYTVTVNTAPAATSTLNVYLTVDNSQGGSAAPSNFTVSVIASPTSTFPGDASGTAVTIDANESYGVNVSSLTDYTMGTSGSCNGTNALPASSSITCAITETFLPLISQQGSSNPTTDSITVTWTTDHPATSRVIYDTVSHPDPLATSTANYGYANSTVEDSTLLTSHSVTVSGLAAGTTYYFRAVSHGSPETVSDEFTGTTTSPAPL